MSQTKHSEGTVPLIIGGKDTLGANEFPVTNPASGKPVWNSSGASVSNAVAAAEAAQKAFPSWSKTKPGFRRDIFLRASDIFRERYDELEQCQKDETGADSNFVHWILNLTIENLRDVAGKCAMVQGSIPQTGDEGRAGLVLKEPYGVILGIAPWNAPWPLGVRAIAYALAAGNTCILKGSELSPRCYYLIVAIFRQAGLPDGVLNLVLHRPQDASEVTTALVAHPAVKKVNFTGSMAVGAIISAIAGKYLKPIITELGGKASIIVLRDADVEAAAKAAVMGAFLHAGQVCMSTDRVIVHSALVDEFTAAFKKAIASSYGPDGNKPTLVSPAGANKTKGIVGDALKRGAEVIYGDTAEWTATDGVSSAQINPLVLGNVDKQSRLYLEESFGPSVTMHTFNTETEALEIANDTEYGLTGAVFTRDLAAGLRIAKGYETGAVHINHMTIHDEANLPHGGTKRSGFGRFTALAGLDEWLRYKVVTYDE